MMKNIKSFIIGFITEMNDEINYKINIDQHSLHYILQL